MSKTTSKFSPDLRERAVRLVLGTERQHGSRWQAIMSIAAKIGCSAHTLNDRVKKAEIDSGKRAGIPADMAEKMKALERENRELRQCEEDQKTVRWAVFPTNEILRKASAYFAMAELDRLRTGMRRRSSRSATFCRSPRPLTGTTGRGGLIPPGGRTLRGGTRRYAPRSGGGSSRTGGSMACARSGTSCAARVSISPAARWHG